MHCHFCVIYTGLNVQILKPAGFVETAHYPLLLLVWVIHRQHWHMILMTTIMCITLFVYQRLFIYYQFWKCVVMKPAVLLWQGWHPRWTGGDGAVWGGLDNGTGQLLQHYSHASGRPGQWISGDKPSSSG